MPSTKSSFRKDLLETTVELCDQCHFSYPSLSKPLLGKAGEYLAQHAANEIPPDCEIPYLSEALQEALAELKGCALELRKMRDVVHKLKERQRFLQDMTYRLRGMVRFSIRRLPPEILSLVFVIAQQERDESWSSCRVPLILGQVCSQWRAITHSDPWLWTHIQVDFHADDDELAAHKILELTKFCLKKSLPKPIQIHFTTPEPEGKDEDEVYLYRGELHQPVLAVVLASCDRWKAADLFLWPGDTIIFPHPTPMLENLSIDVQVSTLFWDPLTSVESLSAPRLSYLCFGGPLECTELKQVDLNALTRLIMEDYCTDTLFHILKHSSNLREVEVRGDCNHLFSQHEYGSPIISRLQTLTTEFSYSMEDVFAHLSLPSMTSLHVIEGRPELFRQRDPQFQPFISRSSPPLTHLHLRVFTIPYNDLIGALVLLPTVTHLNLDIDDHSVTWEVNNGTAFLRRMTVASNSTANDVLLPNLVDLRIELGFPAEAKYVVKMVESRSRVATHGLTQQLEALRLDFRDGIISKHRNGSAWVRKRIESLGLDSEVRIH